MGEKEKRIVDSRIDIFKKENVLLKTKCLSRNFSLYEFKWDSGIRVYFSLLKDEVGNFMLLLIGGNKNTQKFDITEAKKMALEAMTSIQQKRIERPE